MAMAGEREGGRGVRPDGCVAARCASTLMPAVHVCSSATATSLSALRSHHKRTVASAVRLRVRHILSSAGSVAPAGVPPLGASSAASMSCSMCWNGT